MEKVKDDDQQPWICYPFVRNHGKGALIHCCATLCSIARGPFDYFEIRISTNLKVIERIMYCTIRLRSCGYEFHVKEVKKRRPKATHKSGKGNPKPRNMS
jgi:hypothetical protein